MNKKYFRIIFLSLIFLMLVISFINVNFNSSKNSTCQLDKSNSLLPKTSFGNQDPYGSSEPRQGLYCFTGDFYYHDPIHSNVEYYIGSYGTHDWIADSAIRLILENPQYRNKVSWLFASDTNDPTEWAFGVNSLPYDLDPSDNKYFTYYTSKASVNNNEINWLKLRRYVNFLHGTGTPDYNFEPESGAYIDIESKYVPTEYIHETGVGRSTGGTKGSHSLYLYNTSNAYYVDLKMALETSNFVNGIKNQMNTFLTKNYTYRDENTGQMVNRTGKYEAAAQCLGSLTHFVSDKALPAHVCKIEWWDTEPAWTSFSTRRTIFDESGVSFIKGGPQWNGQTSGGINLFDPRTEINRMDLILQPKAPFLATYELAEHTFAVIDKYGPDLSLKPLHQRPEAAMWFRDHTSWDSDAIFRERMINLTSLAVYYSACAILGALNNTNVDPNNCVGRTDNLTPKELIAPVNPIPIANPQPVEEIEESVSETKKSAATNLDSGNLMMLGLIGFIPLVAVIIIPFFFGKLFDEEKNKMPAIPAGQ